MGDHATDYKKLGSLASIAAYGGSFVDLGGKYDDQEGERDPSGCIRKMGRGKDDELLGLKIVECAVNLRDTPVIESPK